MWNNLLKLTLASYLWKRYRRTLIALPLLLLYFWLVNLIHDDYLAYAQLNNSQSGVGLSFVIKWAFIFLGVVIFVFIHLINGFVHGAKRPQYNQDTLSATIDDTELGSDAFDSIRRKHKLRSRADVILDKQSK